MNTFKCCLVYYEQNFMLKILPKITLNGKILRKK